MSVQAPLDHGGEMALSESGFESGGKRNFLHITDKDGEQPQCASVSEPNKRPLLEFSLKSLIPLYVDVRRMSQEQLTAAAWTTAHRNASLGPCQEMALWAAAETTAVHRTRTLPS